MQRSLGLLAGVLFITAGLVTETRAGVITTVGLGTPTVTASSATFPVSVTFPGAMGDQVEALQLSVLGSDPLLTAHGSDFTRFLFTPDPVTLPGWIALNPVSASGVGLFAPADPLAGPFLFPSPAAQPVGLLTVDVSGIPGGTDLLVTLADGPAGQATDLGGTVGSNLIPSFADDTTGAVSLGFAEPNGVGFRTQEGLVIPEPGTVLLLGAGLLGLLGGAWRRIPT